jgi:multiple sugar transport system permease protein
MVTFFRNSIVLVTLAVLGDLISTSLVGLAFFICLMRQFIMTLPFELDDAARIDGCGVFRIYGNIILSLTTPQLATVAIFSFQNTWNQFSAPLISINIVFFFAQRVFIQGIVASGVKG